MTCILDSASQIQVSLFCFNEHLQHEHIALVTLTAVQVFKHQLLA